MNIRPLDDRILIRRKEAKTTTTGGLYIPAAAQEKSNLAIVVAVGPGRIHSDGVLRSLNVEVGQTVLIGKWQGSEVKMNGEDYLILKIDDVLAVVDE